MLVIHVAWRATLSPFVGMCIVGTDSPRSVFWCRLPTVRRGGSDRHLATAAYLVRVKRQPAKATEPCRAGNYQRTDSIRLSAISAPYPVCVRSPARSVRRHQTQSRRGDRGEGQKNGARLKSSMCIKVGARWTQGGLMYFIFFACKKKEDVTQLK